MPSEDGGGCVYLGGQTWSMLVINCWFSVNSGVCLFYNGIHGLEVINGYFTGSYTAQWNQNGGSPTVGAPLSSLTESGTTVTATTPSPHGLVGTFNTSITGASPSGYNIYNVTATVQSATTFSYTAGSSGLGAGTGNWWPPPQSSGVSYGIVTHSPSAIRSVKFMSLGTCVQVWRWGIIIENIDEEVSGIGLSLGINDKSYYDGDLSQMVGGGQFSGSQDVVIRNFNTESNSIYDLYINAVNQFIMENCVLASFNNLPQAAIHVNNLSWGSITNVTCQGGGAGFICGGFDLSAVNQFDSMVITNFTAGGGVVTNYKANTVALPNAAKSSPPVWINPVNFDPSTTVALLATVNHPDNPTALDILVHDSTVAGPFFGGSTASFGATVLGGSSNKAWVRWNGSHWVISG
jgi:hypothetical protein